VKIAILAPNFFLEVAELSGKDRILYGGGERYLYELWRNLTEKGHVVDIYQPLRSPNTVDEYGKRHNVPFGQIAKNYKGMKVICIENNERWEYGVNPKLNMYFNEIGSFYDLRIYYTTYMAYPFALNPSISVCHGIYWDYPHFVYNIADENVRQEYFKRHLYGFTAPDICVSVDSNVKKVIKAIKPGADSNIHIIYNFVDTNGFKPVEKNESDVVNIICPRRLTTLRGCNEFIKLYREHVEETKSEIMSTEEYKTFSDSDVPDDFQKAVDYLGDKLKEKLKYNFVSVGAAANEESGQNFISYYKGSPNIRFVDTDMDGMVALYQEADISVIPTMACEGLSLSSLESMSCGLPVITTPVGGLGDSIIHGYNGFIYDPQYESLHDYVRVLGRNRSLRKLLGRRGREIAIESFDISIWREKWSNVINLFRR